MFLQACLVLGVLAPLASFAWIVLRRLPLVRVPRSMRADSAPAAGEPLAGYVATAAIGLSLVLSIIVLVVWAGAGIESRAAWARAAGDAAAVWMNLGVVPVHLGVMLDSLTIIMFLMITLCATCIHVFSLGFMRREVGFARFFAFLSLFCFSMLGLIVSVDLLVLFVFWELVGVCSYFLIGHWFDRKSATDAAVKAFIVNRVGDFGFMIALGLCAAYLGTLSLDTAPLMFEAAARSGSQSAAAHLFTTSFAGVSLATWLGVGFFCGAIAKSAQFPLHVWLPEAMEGPTPISALIHAATMVAAGVYLLARVFPLLTAEAQTVVAVVGCITLTLGALLALVQTDIKRVLAYSTVSQLGYMMFGLGVGAWTGATFHLLVHAFFKALLFLGAGQVIVACGGESDMRRLGGLAKKLPRTAVTFLIAVLAASDVGIPWTPLGVGGFYSKDEILAVAFQRCAGGAGAFASSLPPLSWALVALPLVVAYLTPFYMGRCFVLTFLGRPRAEQTYRQARENPLLVGPLLVLGAMTLVSGWFLFRPLAAQSAPLHTAFAAVVDGHNWAALRTAHTWLPLLTGLAGAVGLAAAFVVYRDGTGLAERIRRGRWVAPWGAIVENRFYLDTLYNAIFVRGVRALAGGCRLFDRWILDVVVHTLAHAIERIGRFTGAVLDDIAVEGAASAIGGASWRLGGVLRSLQTGLVRNYVLFAATGVTGLLVFLVTDHRLDWALLIVLASVAAIATPWHKMRQVG